jgi:hypothetical protein
VGTGSKIITAEQLRKLKIIVLSNAASSNLSIEDTRVTCSSLFTPIASNGPVDPQPAA